MSISGTDDTIAPPASGLDDTVAPQPSGLDDTVVPPTPASHLATLAAGSAADRSTLVPASPASSAAGGAAPSDEGGLGTVAYSSYAFERALSRGGMGKISIVTDRRLRRTVALKEVIADGSQARRRFLREAEITAQLQHPSIVPIYEAGYWPNGEPFYAMKLVEGRPLSALITETSTLRDRLALLPNVVAVSDALAYAHARRVVHRDLKPDNVLVGEYGETVVIDWGLAKRLATAEDPDAGNDSDSVVPRSSAGVLETMAGATLGTPAFMSPEQGRGEPIDERTDVYALGAILYNLLTGTVPYGDSKSVVELLDRLEREQPRRVTDIAPDAPPDLVTIVEKAMARDAAARYASARELADDLRRYTTGQLVGAHVYSLRQLLARWVRRHRGALAVAAFALAAIVVLAGFGLQRIRHERNVAEAQRAEARAHRADVEGLLDFMLTDLRRSLAKTGRLDALGVAVDRVQQYFATHDPGDSPDDLARAAKASNSVAQVLVGTGDYDHAVETYGRGAALAQRALRIAPQHPAALEAWWTSLANQARWGTTHNQFERPDALLAELKNATIPATVDDDLRDQLVAKREAAIADVAAARGDHEAQKAARTAEIEPRRRLVERKPEMVDRSIELAGVYADRALVAIKRWELDAARADTDAAIAVLAGPLAREPSHQDLRLANSMMYDRLGDIEQARGKQAEALAAFEKALSIMDDLHQLDGSNIDYTRKLSIAENKVSTALMNRGDLAGATTHLMRSTAIAEQLHERDLLNDEWSRDLSIAYDREAALAQFKGRLDDALAFARKSEAVRTELLARRKNDSNAYRDLGISQFMVGQMLADMGKNADAVVAYRAADESFAKLIELEPATTNFQIDRSEVRKNLGWAMAANGDLEGGAAVMRATWETMRDLVQRPEATDMWRLMMGMVGERYVEVLLEQKKRADAVPIIAEAVTAIDKLVASQPEERMYAQELATSLALQARALDEPATARAAAAALARSKTVIAALVAKSPENADLRRVQAQIEAIHVGAR